MAHFAIAPEAAAAEMERAYPQLYYRIKQLEDRLVSYFLRGNAQCVVSYGCDRSAVPRFSGVTFDGERAERYEARMARYFATYKKSAGAALPKPGFSVRLDVDLGGACEQFDFSFLGYGEESVLAFCERIAERADTLFRHRFTAPKA